LRPRIIRTEFGAQPIHIHLDIPDTLTLVGLNSDTAAHWQRARARYAHQVARLARQHGPRLPRHPTTSIDSSEFTESTGDADAVDIATDNLDAFGLRISDAEHALEKARNLVQLNVAVIPR
jgi:hypothetical protein